mmetsp:Transcript_12777/g.21594  ORF Transcript_12777/g.21594 Transcript_12777/m.21594 type:complete len:414 (-) Transcript_12777:76-1317(-)
MLFDELPPPHLVPPELVALTPQLFIIVVLGEVLVVVVVVVGLSESVHPLGLDHGVLGHAEEDHVDHVDVGGQDEDALVVDLVLREVLRELDEALVDLTLAVLLGLGLVELIVLVPTTALEEEDEVPNGVLVDALRHALGEFDDDGEGEEEEGEEVEDEVHVPGLARVPEVGDEGLHGVAVDLEHDGDHADAGVDVVAVHVGLEDLRDQPVLELHELVEVVDGEGHQADHPALQHVVHHLALVVYHPALDGLAEADAEVLGLHAEEDDGDEGGSEDRDDARELLVGGRVQHLQQERARQHHHHRVLEVVGEHLDRARVAAVVVDDGGVVLGVNVGEHGQIDHLHEDDDQAAAVDDHHHLAYLHPALLPNIARAVIPYDLGDRVEHDEGRDDEEKHSVLGLDGVELLGHSLPLVC